jgi:hypothetical protein
MSNNHTNSEILTAFFINLQKMDEEISCELGQKEKEEFRGLTCDFLASQSSKITPFMANKQGLGSYTKAKVMFAGKMRHFVKTKIPFSLKEKMSQSSILRGAYQYLEPKNFMSKSNTVGQQNESIEAQFFNLCLSDIMKLSDQIASDKEGVTIGNDNDNSERLIFVSHIFPTTWNPLLRELSLNGIDCVWVGNRKIENSASYGVLGNDEIHASEKCILDFFEILLGLVKTKDSKILISAESFIGANWTSYRVVALYCLLASLLKTLSDLSLEQNKSFYLMLYDALKPVSSSSNVGNALSICYKKLLENSNGLIFNSNTQSMSDFIRNSYGIKKPFIHYYRYAEFSKKVRLPKNKKEFHVVCITVCLTEFEEPSRDNISFAIRDILKSGVHLHYYCDPKARAVKKFTDSLDSVTKSYFHVHRINKNHGELLNEISKFDFGLNPSDHVALSKGISSLSDRNYADALDVFWQSTIATSFLVYAAAGLPVILPRGCSGAVKLLGHLAIPINPSEYQNINQILNNFIDEQVESVSSIDTSVFTHKQQIKKLLEFLELKT